MPIVNPDDQPPVAQPAVVQVAAPEFKGVAVDTKYIPSSSLLTNVEGSSWTVNYYSQVLNDDSQLGGQKTGLNAIYQQYRLIKGMELKVTSPLTTTQDNESKSMTLVGAANVYPFLIPNLGDMFIADIGDGRGGIFKITRSERRSVFKDTCYAIEYTLIDYVTPERFNDLESKSVQRLQFVKDFLQHGQNPLLTDEDFATAKELEGRYWELVEEYVRSFISSEFKTFLLPAQDVPVYDHFLTKAVTTILSVRDVPKLLQVRRLNVDGDDAMKTTTIWDALIKKDKRLLRHAFKSYGLVSVRTFEKNPMMEGIFYSGISDVVYPKDPELSVDYLATNRTKLVGTRQLVDSPSRVALLTDLFGVITFNGLPYEQAPLLNRVADDDCYVFSQAFYDQDKTKQSKLELCVGDYLEGNALDNRLLLTFCDTYHSWGGLERFYYVPIVLMLIKASIRSL